MDNSNWMVFVFCTTFNQTPYINDALDGFCLQQTTFPFVCGVIDDASTDGEQEKLRQYLADNFDFSDPINVIHEETNDYERYFVRHKKNLNCFFVVVLLHYNHYQIKKSKRVYISNWIDKAKYVAFCEGDDYWVDPNKLQMQVDYLENHPDYVLCHTDFEATRKRHSHYRERFVDGNYIPGMFQKGFMIGTLTVMYRMSAYNNAPKYYLEKHWPMGDKPLWYELASLGKVKYFPVITAVYRILNTSASHFTDLNKQVMFKRAGLDIKRFYAQKFGIVLKNDGYTKSFYSSLLQFAFKFNNIDMAERFYHEAKEKHLISISCLLYYWGTKSRLIRRCFSIIIK